jgi:hypothetical protein
MAAHPAAPAVCRASSLLRCGRRAPSRPYAGVGEPRATRCRHGMLQEPDRLDPVVAGLGAADPGTHAVRGSSQRRQPGAHAPSAALAALACVPGLHLTVATHRPLHAPRLQSFNAVNTLRVLGRWMRMCVPCALVGATLGFSGGVGGGIGGIWGRGHAGTWRGRGPTRSTLSAAWRRRFVIPNQSSIPKAWTEFDELGRLKDSPYRHRVVDVAGAGFPSQS